MKKYNKRKFPKKTYKKRKFTKKGKVTTAKIGLSIPDRSMVKMRYCDNILLLNNLSTNVEWIYRSTSIFDPDLSGTGHQPLSHDQWATFYQRYVVFKYNIKVVFTNLSTTEPVRCFLYPQANTSTVPASVLALLEQKYLRQKVCGVSQGNSTCTLTLSMTNKKIAGIGKISFSDESYSSLFGSNPAINNFIIFGIQSLDGSFISANVCCDVTLDLSVGLSNRVVLAQS